MKIALPLILLNNMPWFWLGIAILMTILEGMTMGLTTIWLALAALVSMVLAFFIPSVTAQITIFLVLSIVLFIFTRPVALKKMKHGKIKTNSDRLIGMTGLVTETVSTDEPGQVKVGGQIWTARPAKPDDILEKGQSCVIKDIVGVTVLIASESTETSTNDTSTESE